MSFFIFLKALEHRCELAAEEIRHKDLGFVDIHGSKFSSVIDLQNFLRSIYIGAALLVFHGVIIVNRPVGCDREYRLIKRTIEFHCKSRLKEANVSSWLQAADLCVHCSRPLSGEFESFGRL